MSGRGSWHLRGVALPDGGALRDWWIADGRWCEGVVPGASEVPGAWVIPGGLADAHVHLTMNFGRVMPHPDGSDALVSANQGGLGRAGVLAVRDAGYAWGGVPRHSSEGPRLQRAGAILAPPGRGYPNVCRSAEPDRLVEIALEEVAEGAQWVKVLADFPGPDGNWFTAQANYPRDVLATLVREAHAAGARVMARAAERGVPIIAGTDEIGVGALAREAESLSRFGLANSQAIAAISTSARAWLGFPPPQIGEPADAVTFATDPREDLSSLPRPAAVLFAGDLVPLA